MDYEVKRSAGKRGIVEVEVWTVAARQRSELSKHAFALSGGRVSSRAAKNTGTGLRDVNRSDGHVRNMCLAVCEEVKEGCEIDWRL